MERRIRLTEEDLLARERGKRFNGWQNADSLKQWERETELADAEALRQQMERQKSPPLEVNWRVLGKIVGAILLGALFLYAMACLRALGK